MVPPLSKLFRALRRKRQDADRAPDTLRHPKDECQALVNAFLPLARKLLIDHGEFLPYGAAMRPTGEIVSVSALDGRERPPSKDLITLLKNSFASSARTGEYKATAIFYDVRIGEDKKDAVAVSLDHRDGYSVIVFFPYEVAAGILINGAPIAQMGVADIFPARIVH
jgi:hypothetical protein